MLRKDTLSSFNNEKDKIVGKNIFFAFVIKGASLLISLFSLPVYIRFFNNDSVLGVWFTILSILSWFLTFDFGIGNGLRNKLVGAIEKKDNQKIKEYISTGYVSLFYLSLAVYIILVPIFFILNWNTILNISEVNSTILKISMIINLTTIMAQFFLRLITFILYATQKSSINNFITFSTSFSLLLIVLILPSFGNEQNLIILSIVNLITTTTPLLIATLWIFSKPLKGMFPNRKLYRKEMFLEIFSSGGKIFINQILYMLLTATNVYLITSMIGPNEVVEYQIYYRIFILIGTLVMIMLTPVWSAITKAHVEKDYRWIKKYLKLTMITSLIAFVGQFILIIPLQFGFNIWLGENAPLVNLGYAFIFAIFGGVFILQNTVSVFAMGFDRPKIQMLFYFIALLIKASLIAALISRYSNWALFVFIDIIAFIPYIIAELIHVNRLIFELQSEVEGQKYNDDKK